MLADLARVRDSRDASKVDASLRSLAEVARSKQNLVDAFLACVESYATLGEICAVLEREFGAFKADNGL